MFAETRINRNHYARNSFRKLVYFFYKKSMNVLMSIFDFKLDVSLPYLCESPKRWTCILNNLHSKSKQFIFWQTLFVDFLDEGISLSQQIFVVEGYKFLEETGNEDVLWGIVLDCNCADEFDDFEMGKGYLESALGYIDGGSGRVGFEQTAKHLLSKNCEQISTY